ncbi:unnamed protein product [Clonostachys rhizophaga]|uniref:Zn(2)-C6 fungal-type domain-containing protein n=1 Tax=Clonostachys rhizophaga TaxID=160324 RepID=A0A9N9YUP3_9HYPO|nr:unnamed protein product [Clonostachys rhizophaga]
MDDDGAAGASTASAPIRRKVHVKSRLGCFECKRRRVKCNEGKPSCGNCVRRLTTCVYPSRDRQSYTFSATESQSPSLSDDGHHSEHAQSPSYSSPFLTSPEAYALCPTHFCLEDLALLHHWTTTTSRTIYQTPKYDHLWGLVCPQIGLQHIFLLQAIFSITSLHLAETNPAHERHHVVTAIRHHGKALQGFSETLYSANASNGEALVLFTTLNIFYTFAINKKPEPDANDVSRRRAILLGAEWIPMVRGVGTVLGTVFDHIRFGRLEKLFSINNWDSLDLDGMAASEYFDGIEVVWAQSQREDIAMYELVLRLLKQCRMFMVQFQGARVDDIDDSSYNRQWAGPLVFIHCVPEQYFERLQQRQPPALVLFTFFGAMLNSLDHIWCFSGWGRNIISAAEEVLGDYWKQWTERSRRMMEAGS